MENQAKSIIVTGAGSGIGRATARLFMESGWKTVLVGRTESRLEETAQGSVNAIVMPADVANPAEVSEAFGKAREMLRRIDVLFNNAGISLPGATIDEIDVGKWDELMRVNLHGAFYCAREAFRIMRHQDPQGGRIINNGSVSAHVPRPGSAPYTASKHAITGLTRSISLDGRKFGIACGQIDIGNALTEMARPMTKGVPQADGSNKPEAVMDVGNVAKSVLHMASLPLDANVQFMTVMATGMPFIGRG